TQPLARPQRRQEALLLLLGAGEHDRDAAERLVEVLRARRGARRRDLLAHHRQPEPAHRAPAIRFGYPDAVKAPLAQRADGVFRVFLGIVVARGVGRDALARDLPREVADHALIVREIERLVHAEARVMRDTIQARPARGRETAVRSNSLSPPDSPRWDRLCARRSAV